MASAAARRVPFPAMARTRAFMATGEDVGQPAALRTYGGTSHEKYTRRFVAATVATDGTPPIEGAPGPWTRNDRSRQDRALQRVLRSCPAIGPPWGAPNCLSEFGAWRMLAPRCAGS